MPDIHSFEPIWTNWVIDEEIGRGSFGTVWKAHREDAYTRITQYAAVKHISIPSDGDSNNIAGYSKETDRKIYRGQLNELVKEIKAMVELRGRPYIVAYEEHKIVEKAEGIGYDLFLRMELLTSLPNHTKKNGELGQDEVIKLGIHLAKALETLQSKKFIHRDIKPANIFIDAYGDYKLGDFGTARVLQTTGHASIRTGTLNYMAPEVYNGSTSYDQTVDIYSLGVLLYRYMNRGFLPFVSEEEMDHEAALIRRAKGEALPPPSQASEGLSRVILKACAYRPEDRYQTAREMWADLEALQQAPNPVPKTACEVRINCVLEDSQREIQSTIIVCPKGEDALIHAPQLPGYEVVGSGSVRIGTDASGRVQDKVTFTYRMEQTVVSHGVVPVIAVSETGEVLHSGQAQVKQGETTWIDAPRVPGYEVVGAQRISVSLGADGRCVPETAAFRMRRQAQALDRTLPGEKTAPQGAGASGRKPPEVRGKQANRTKLIVGGVLLAVVIALAALLIFRQPADKPEPTATPAATTTTRPSAAPSATPPASPSPTPTATPAASLKPTPMAEPKVIGSGFAEGLKYRLLDNAVEEYAEIVNYEGVDTSVTIPSEFEGRPVRIIGDWAFSDCDSLLSISIPDSVTIVGRYAFASCEPLTSINIPAKAISIGDSAFSGDISLTSLHIPRSVEYMGDNPFEWTNNLSLTISSDNPHYTLMDGMLVENKTQRLVAYKSDTAECIIPMGIKSIGANAFVNSSYGLKKINIPTSVTSIGSNAFQHSRLLSSVNIPPSVTTIGDNPFKDVGTGWDSEGASDFILIVSPEHPYFSLEDGMLIEKNTQRLVSYIQNDLDETECTVPNGIRHIGAETFMGISKLKKINLPASVTSIGELSFAWCSSLISVNMPAGVTTIGSQAFDSCTSLVSVNIPSSMTKIGSFAFDNCPNLKLTVSPGSYGEQYAKENNIPYTTK